MSEDSVLVQADDGSFYRLHEKWDHLSFDLAEYVVNAVFIVNEVGNPPEPSPSTELSVRGTAVLDHDGTVTVFDPDRPSEEDRCFRRVHFSITGDDGSRLGQLRLFERNPRYIEPGDEERENPLLLLDVFMPVEQVQSLVRLIGQGATRPRLYVQTQARLFRPDRAERSNPFDLVLMADRTKVDAVLISVEINLVDE